jgi:hypothetical protein
MPTLAQNFLKLLGNNGAYKTVIFGSGDGPKLYKVCKKRYAVFVTLERPSFNIPPIASVIQVGSPAKISS